MVYRFEVHLNQEVYIGIDSIMYLVGEQERKITVDNLLMLKDAASEANEIIDFLTDYSVGFIKAIPHNQGDYFIIEVSMSKLREYSR